MVPLIENSLLPTPCKLANCAQGLFIFHRNCLFLLWPSLVHHFSLFFILPPLFIASSGGVGSASIASDFSKLNIFYVFSLCWKRFFLSGNKTHHVTNLS